jgi:hypothetical protein
MAIHLGRRDFIAAMGATSVWHRCGPSWPAHSSRCSRPLGFSSMERKGLGRSVDAAFRQGLGKQGYFDGRNVEDLYRQTAMYDHLPELYADLVRRGVAIIASMGAGNPSPTAASSTATTPVVFLIRGDHAASGPAAGHNRPAGSQNVSICCWRSRPLDNA